MSRRDPLSTLRFLSRRLGFEAEWYLIVVGAFIGVATALSAIAFAFLLHTLEHWVVDAARDVPPWALPIFPMTGALLSGLAVWRFASEARGHGVPQVMTAVIQRNGHIPLRVGLVKSVASIFTVGSGGSAGTEGPIVQIGATVGSVLGRFVKIPPQHLRTLVGCGAAAGIASIFNAPIAGVLFVLEIILRDFSVRVFSPIVVAAVFSAAATHALTGSNVAIFAADALQRQYEFSAVELPSFAVLGIACGLVAVAFNWLLHLGEDTFERLRVHPAVKPVVGAALLGLLGIVYLAALPGATASPLPAFFGNGYESIRHLLDPGSYLAAATDAPPPLPVGILFLVAVLLLKAIGTTCTLGSGGSGGVFAPSLFLGAVTGAAFGSALDALGLLPDGGSPAAYALVGMGAVLAGSAHAPITGILLLLEVTGDQYVLLPTMFAAVVSTVLSQVLQRDSIYTYKLRRAGVLVGRARDLTLLRRLRVVDVEPEPIPAEPIYPSDPLAKLITLHASHNVPDFVVVNLDGSYLGLVTGADIRTALIDREAIPLLLVAELVRTDLPTVRGADTLDTVMDKFARHDVAALCQVDERNQPVTLITRRRALQGYQRALEED